MKKRTITQYQCEFCKKRGLSGSHMAKHERHCTLNPNRICRVCSMSRGNYEQGQCKQAPMSEILKILPDPKQFARNVAQEFGPDYEEWPGLSEAFEKVLPALRELTCDCPACIFAGIRQKGITPHAVADHFSFTKEMKEIWDGINENRLESCDYGQ